MNPMKNFLYAILTGTLLAISWPTYGFPLFIFIGRLVGEKAADILPAAILKAYKDLGEHFSFLILGSGDKKVELQLEAVQKEHVGYYNTQIAYNEKLSHQMYAGADFLLMPIF